MPPPINTARRERIYLFFDMSVCGTDGIVASKAFYFDPARIYFGKRIKFCCDAQVTDIAEKGKVYLYNVDDHEYVSHPGLGLPLEYTGSLDFQHLETLALTVGSAAGDLRDTPKYYEAHLRIVGVVGLLLNASIGYLEIY